MIIEFAGLPKSGKSSTIGVVRDYFLRNGFEVRLFAEGAKTCPFGNQKRIEIACWTANRTLNSVLESKLSFQHETLVIQDRGLFDALAFFELLHLDGFVASAALNNLMDYFADPRWTQSVDLIILLGVTPEKAIERDLATLISKLPGVITNLPTMDRLLVAYNIVLEKYGDRFPRIEQLNTTNTELVETANAVIKLIQSSLPK